jgi:hypothetical protein
MSTNGFRYFNVAVKGLAPGLLMSNGQMADPDNWYYRRIDELRNKNAAGEEVERQRIKYHITGRLYLNTKKQIVIPSEMVTSVLRKGASSVSVKNGRKWWSGITVTDDAVLEVDDLPPWDTLHENEEFVHRCMARAANGAPQPRYRPYFRRWTATIPVELDVGALDVSTLETIFRAAGKAVGLGDWRPSSPKNPGKFGRFGVMSINERAETDEATLPIAA